jgi:hypothetical protein
MSELAYLLRLMVQGDKEAVSTRVTAGHIPQLFASQLQGGNTRRRLNVHNNSASGSGEVGYMYTGEANFDHAIPLPAGEKTWIPVSSDLSVYYMAQVSGEQNLDLRFEEIS